MIKSISNYKYQQKSQANKSCPVCLNEFQTTYQMIITLKCGHDYHPTCLENWVSICNTDENINHYNSFECNYCHRMIKGHGDNQHINSYVGDYLSRSPNHGNPRQNVQNQQNERQGHINENNGRRIGGSTHNILTSLAGLPNQAEADTSHRITGGSSSELAFGMTNPSIENNHSDHQSRRPHNRGPNRN